MRKTRPGARDVSLQIIYPILKEKQVSFRRKCRFKPAFIRRNLAKTEYSNQTKRPGIPDVARFWRFRCDRINRLIGANNRQPLRSTKFRQFAEPFFAVRRDFDFQERRPIHVAPGDAPTLDA